MKKLAKRFEKGNSTIRAQRASCWCSTPHNCMYYCNIQSSSEYVYLYDRNLDKDYDANPEG